MKIMNSIEESKRFYFVDEAGDGSLFDHRSKVIIGNDGCSKYFILGCLDVPDQVSLTNDLTLLRQQLISDPYFKDVPSMQPDQRKTYLTFHAKDDLPEVRREVFSILRKYDLRFFAALRNKYKVLDYVRQRNDIDPKYHYRPDELYDYLVRVLFKNRLHKEQEYEIVFSKRGQQTRTESLKQAIKKAQARFAEQWNVQVNSIVSIEPKQSVDCVPLQAVDYFLWALQRFYEKREDRYLEYIWPSVRVIHDLDDNRKAKSGCYYTQKKPLKLAALDNTLPGI
jgi:hypothetical protein